MPESGGLVINVHGSRQSTGQAVLLHACRTRPPPGLSKAVKSATLARPLSAAAATRWHPSAQAPGPWPRGEP
eukprot:scaffold29592_cov64-Phaeocystis_antarctica.AAC.4